MACASFIQENLGKCVPELMASPSLQSPGGILLMEKSMRKQ
jgi:hypothetical protein